MFGERGDEWVVPEDRMGRGAPFVDYHPTVNARTVDFDEPEMMRRLNRAIVRYVGYRPGW